MLDLATASAPNGHHAIQRCLHAGQTALALALSQQKTKYQCEDSFREAYLKAMPALSTLENISDFIACVTYADITDIILRNDCKSYLYGAQVALTSVRRSPAKSKSEAA